MSNLSSSLLLNRFLEDLLAVSSFNQFVNSLKIKKQQGMSFIQPSETITKTQSLLYLHLHPPAGQLLIQEKNTQI